MNGMKFNGSATKFDAELNTSNQSFDAELNASEQTFAADFHKVSEVKAQIITEQWTLTLMDDTVVTKDVVMA